jgi:hypothetical protein
MRARERQKEKREKGKGKREKGKGKREKGKGKREKKTTHGSRTRRDGAFLDVGGRVARTMIEKR